MYVYVQASTSLFLTITSSSYIFINRFGEVTFVASQAGTVHGFTGTFESVLFDDVTLSIMPRVHIVYLL